MRNRLSTTPKTPNQIRILLGRLINNLFNHFFTFYYNYGSCNPPFKYYIEGFSHLSKEDINDAETSYGWYYDPSCFPLPFKINCIGCHGCGSNKDPLLSPDKSKGPWKIMLTDTFKEDYRMNFGDEALINLMVDLDEHNASIK